MDLLKSILGRNIRKHRLKRGMTQEELSDRAGVHYTFLGHIERGKKVPSLHTLRRLSQALGLSIAALFQGL